MSYYFENNYQPEITCIADTISNIDYLCESSTDKKFINTLQKTADALKEKIYQKFENIEPDESGVKKLDETSPTSTFVKTCKYYHTGLFKTDNCTLFLKPFAFVPNIDDSVNIPMKMLFTYTDALRNSNPENYRFSSAKTDFTKHTGLPENFSHLLYNYIQYVADGGKDKAGTNNLIKLKKDIQKFRNSVASRSTSDLQPIFNNILQLLEDGEKLVDECREIDCKYSTNYELYNKDKEFMKRRHEIYNSIDKKADEVVKLFNIISTEIITCRKYECKLAKSIGFISDTEEAQKMYTMVMNKSYDTVYRVNDFKTSYNPKDFTNPFLVMETNPYRKTLIADVTLKNHAFRKLHTYSHPHIPNDSGYDLRYIEKPSIHIPYLSKTDVDAIIQCFKENTAHEYEMYHIKPVNERNYVEKKTEDNIVIAYKASLSTMDYINKNCEIKTVDNVNITDVLFSPDKPSDICHVNNLEDKLMHQRFLLKTQMLIPEISDDRYLFILSHCDRIRKFIENYDEIKSHITNTMDECVAIIDMLQTQLASIDDEDFKNYLINIKMINAPKN